VGVIRADSVVFGRAPWTEYDVPFVFTDTTVRNGFPYVYAVTAFDVNSVRSGPSSLESPLVTKSVTPRVGSGQETLGAIAAPVLLGGDGKVLTGTMPTLDAATGEFSGPMPPSDGIGLGLVGFVPQLVDSGSVTVTIDSIVPADGWSGKAGTYFYTVRSALGAVGRTAQVLVDNTLASGYVVAGFPALHATQSKAARFGGDSTYTTDGALSLSWPGTWDLTNWGRGAANGWPSGNQGLQGPRWWVASANENTPSPNGGMCYPSRMDCGTSTEPVPNLANTAGSLGSGVQVMVIEGYSTAPNNPLRQIHAMTSYLARAADFKVYWGNAGAVDSVVDVTHHVPVPFNPVLRASWGILNDSSFVSTTAALTPDQSNAVLRWDDVTCIAPIPTLLTATGTLVNTQACGGPAQAPAVLMSHARLSPVVFASSAFAASTSAATGNGFIFYIAGQFFLMQMTTLPTAGTVWNLRTYAGNVLSSYSYPPTSFTFLPSTRPPAVPGLRIRIGYTGSTFTPGVTSAAALAAVHTVPDPYYYVSAYEPTGSDRQLRFINLPSECIIRIYSVSGILVRLLTHNDPTGGGEEPWDLRTREGLLAASGVYFYHVQTPDGHTKIGRFTILNLGP
jgi:hypothetical protein